MVTFLWERDPRCKYHLANYQGPYLTWFLPLLWPSITFLLILLFGPCIINTLSKFIFWKVQKIQFQMILQKGYQPVDTRTMLYRSWIYHAMSFCGVPPSSLSIPWQRAGKGNPEPHDPPVQPEEVRGVIATFPLRLGSQMLRREISR